MKKLKYSIQPTSEQSLYLYRTMCAYNVLYNIFATHPTLEQREKHASKYLCKFFTKYGDDVDKVAIERYYADLLKKTDYKFKKRGKEDYIWHYTRFDTSGIEVFGDSIFVPGIGLIKALVHRAYKLEYLYAIKFSILEHGQYSVKLSFNITEKEHISDNYYHFRNEMRYGGKPYS